MTGILALVGGREFTDGCTFDETLLGGASEVLAVPTALAYENPTAAIDRATVWFAGLGASVRTLEVYRHADAMDPDFAAQIADAPLIYFTGGSPMHLRSVLKGTPLLDALVAAWEGGTNVAAAGEAASVLCSHMVDSRGGAFTVGLDLITTMTVIPRYNQWSPDMWHRTVELAHRGLPVVGIDEATALVRSAEGTWSVQGTGQIHVFVDGSPAGPESLPADLDARA